MGARPARRRERSTAARSPLAPATTIKAIAYESGYTDSAVPTATFAIQPAVATPAFSPTPGSYTTTQSVTISTSTSGATIRYTTDGSTPSETAGTVYSGAITVSATTTINAIAYESGYTDSAVASGTFTIQPTVATPTFTPTPGTYTTTQSVTISTGTSGATIRFTTDGSTPSETAGTVYSSAITVSATTTIKAIAYESGYSDSSVATGSYTISAWYSASWGYRKPITVDHTKVTGGSDLTGYPMLFSVTDSNLPSNAQSSGNDILFTAADGVTKLSHEIESYSSSTGKLIAWVQVPTLSASMDTLIYMYYGNNSASNQQNASGAWDSNYKGVYHLGNGTTLSGNDSTSNANNQTAATATAATGEIGGGASFNGSERITLPNIPMTTGVTLETWIYPTSFSAYDRLVCKAYTSSNPPWTNYCLNFDDTAPPNRKVGMNVTIGGTSYGVTSATSIEANTWYHIVGTYDGSNLQIYINGVSDVAPVAQTGTIDTISQVTEIGYNTVNGSQSFIGTADEVRISSIGRSSGWIGTEYTNQSSPSSFSSVGSAQVSGVVATPTFSPTPGTYTTTQSVTISTSTSGATIRYTTDGSTPSETAGTVYSGAITVSATTTINAIAYASGYTDSAVASGTFTIQPTVATPTFSPTAGTYTMTQSVTISTSTSGATIRYTTDGSTPSETAGTVYSGAITVSATTTLKAIAYESGYNDSSVASGTFTIQPVVATPTFSPTSGTYATMQSVTISTGTSGATIRYTTDGSTPSETAGTVYSGTIAVSASTTLNAIAYESGYTDSAIATATFTIQPMVSTPAFTPAGGAYSTTQNVTITTSTSGATIRYTTDGSTPSEAAGTVYSGSITVSSTTTLNAIAYESGYTDSAVATAIYTMAPSITSLSPTSGAAGVQVTISGSGFGSTQGSGKIWLGSNLGTVVSWSDTQIAATVSPSATSGTAQIQQGGTWSNSVSFSVTTATITNAVPASGLPGTQVTVTGSGFGSSQGTGQIWLGTAIAVVQTWSDTQVVATVGAGAASGNAQILQSGVMSNAIPFSVGLPHTTVVSPPSGSPGTTVTITGSGFGSLQGSGTVWLGSQAATATSWSDTQVVAVVASGALTGIGRVQQNGVWSNALPFAVPDGGSNLYARS